jgi:ATP-binding cassette subfamily B protein
MSGSAEITPIHPTDEHTTSALDVLSFVWGYWRRVPVRFAGMVAGATLGVVLEVQIPRLSAELVVVAEQHLSGAAGADAAWRAAWRLLGLFAAIFVVKQLYMRNWMYLASQVMQQLVADGFRRVQRFSLDWHTSHFAGSTQRKITRGMWAYDALADAITCNSVVKSFGAENREDGRFDDTSQSWRHKARRSSPRS